jgi:hypothetical protein
MVHEVNVRFHSQVVGHKDLEIDVKENGLKLGRLLISRGNIEWRPAWKSVKKHRLSWAKFAALMERRGRAVRSKKKTPAGV